MPDLAEQIQDVVNGSAPPLTVEEVLARIAPASSVVSLMPSPKVSRGRYVYRFGLVGAVAALVALIAVIMPFGGRGHNGSASAAEVLSEAAQTAATQPPSVPGPGQYLYSDVTEGSIVSASPGGSLPDGQSRPNYQFYENTDVQTWANAQGAGLVRQTTVGTGDLISATSRAAWIADGSPSLLSGESTVQEYPANWVGRSQPVLLPYFDVQSLPTDPTKIGAYLQSKGSFGPGPTSQSLFGIACYYLTAGASPSQRAALFQFIATLPGIKATGTAITDVSHLSGTVLSMPGSDPIEGEDQQAIIDPTTSSLLEFRYVVTNPSQYFAYSKVPTYPLPANGIVQYSIYKQMGIANSTTEVPARPDSNAR